MHAFPLRSTVALLVAVAASAHAATTPSPRSSSSEIQIDGAPVGGRFGRSVALDGARAVVGAPGDPFQGGSVSLYDLSGSTWALNDREYVERATVTGQRLGHVVAIVGTYALVGAPEFEGRGRALLYRDVGNRWDLVETFEGSSGDRFGAAVAISTGTPTRLFVGAPMSDTGFGGDTGSVFVFDLSGQPIAEIEASDGATGQLFGAHLAASDAELLVGAPGHSGAGPRAGAAYLFEGGASWTERAILFAPTPAANDGFGSAVALDVGRAAVAASRVAMGTGAVYVFDGQGSSWLLSGSLMASDGEAGDAFGASVALDGDHVLIGAERDDDLGVEAGAVYVFDRTGTDWTQVARIAHPPTTNREFGFHLALDGDRVAIGTIGAAGLGQVGEAYVFERQGIAWVEIARVTPSGGSEYGEAVALDGRTLAVGQPARQGPGYSGAVDVYVERGGEWILQDTLHGPDESSQIGFGKDLALRGGTLWVGSPGLGGVLNGTGGAFRFERCGEEWIEVASFIPSPIRSYGAVALHGQTVLVGDSNPGSAEPRPVVVLDLLDDEIGTLSCPGNGSGANCPCGNETGTSERSGCTNSTGRGALLIGVGSASHGADDLSLLVSELPGSQSALLFGGDAVPGSGLPFGDGLRCAGGQLRRFELATSTPEGAACFGPGMAATHGWSMGATLLLQVWYRDPAGGPCGSSFNTTNGLGLVLGP